MAKTRIYPLLLIGLLLSSCMPNDPLEGSSFNVSTDQSSLSEPSSSISAPNPSSDMIAPSISSEGSSIVSTISSSSQNDDLVYYRSLNRSLTGESLLNALYSLISPHTAVSYDDMESFMLFTDRDWTISPDPNDQNPYMHLIYYTKNDDPNLRQTWNKYYSSKNPTANQMWDKEHIWAKSNGNFGTSKGAGSDLHHLRASDRKNNNTRSSYPLGEVATLKKNVPDFSGTNSGKIGQDALFNTQVYEPIDVDKGDVARALMYMAACYKNKLSLTDNSDSSGGKWGFLSTLLKWHLQDPPDEFEIRRNQIIYEDYQHNRNPYIDYPELACQVYQNMPNASSRVQAVCA